MHRSFLFFWVPKTSEFSGGCLDTCYTNERKKGLEFLQAHLSGIRTVVQTRGKHGLDAVVLKPTLQLKQRAIAGFRGGLTFDIHPRFMSIMEPVLQPGQKQQI